MKHVANKILKQLAQIEISCDYSIDCDCCLVTSICVACIQDIYDHT